MDLLVGLATAASSRPLRQSTIERFRNIDTEELAQTAVDILGRIGSARAIAALAMALRTGPTRWGYAGWALVRLARSGSGTAAHALEQASEDAEDVDLRMRARRFLRLLDTASG